MIAYIIHVHIIYTLNCFFSSPKVIQNLRERVFFYEWPNFVLMAAAFPGLRSLCLAINKSLWITGEAGSQYSCVRVWAGQRNDWSSGGLRARKNAVWWDCRLGGREGGGREGDRCWLHRGEKKKKNHQKVVLKSDLWPKRCIIYQKKVLTEAKAALIGVDSVVLWHLAAPLSTFEPGLPVSSFCLQDNNNTERIWLAQTAANLSARNESRGSHCTYLHSPDTLPGWAQTQHLITFPIQSKTEAHCVP